MRVVIINGAAGSGKDEFVNQCSKFCYTANISIVDPIKDAATLLGWNGAKEDRDRKFLADLKALSVDYNDYPYEYIKSKIQELIARSPDVVFVHMRNPEDIRRAQKDFYAKSLIIKRYSINDGHFEELQPVQSNDEDKNIYSYDYDFVVYNDGDIEKLSMSAHKFIDLLFYQEWSDEE